MSERFKRAAAAVSVLIFSLVVPVLLTATPATAVTRGEDGHAPHPVLLHVSAFPRPYVVRRGDTLSRIAARQYGHSNTWPALWWKNRSLIRNPDAITAGQKITLYGWHPVLAWTLRAAMRHIPKPKPPRPAAVAAAPAAPAAAPVAAAPAAVTYTGGSGFQACVIARESGGNPRAVNPYSGAGGLYQFLPSTWQKLGFSGLPENASVATQNAAFAKEYAQSGTAAWSPYDGC